MKEQNNNYEKGVFGATTALLVIFLGKDLLFTHRLDFNFGVIILTHLWATYRLIVTTKKQE